MEDLKPGIPAYEEESHLIISLQHMLRALVSSQNVSDEFREILIVVDSRLSSMLVLTQNNAQEFSDVEKQLRSALEKLQELDLNWTMTQDCEYLKKVVEIHELVESLRAMSFNKGSHKNKLLLEADSVLHEAMSRLEMELIHILTWHKQNIEPQVSPLQSGGHRVVYNESFVSVDDNLAEKTFSSNYFTPRSEEYVIDLLDPDVILRLKSIAEVMFMLGYEKEFYQIFVNSRRNALDEYLIALGMEICSIDDLKKMRWTLLNNFIKKWIKAMKVILEDYLVSEKTICRQTLEGFETVNSLCFKEISKIPILRLLNCGLAISMGPHRPEMLFSLLDMYEVSSKLLFNVDALFSDDGAASIKFEFKALLLQLSCAAKSVLVQFSNAILSSPSTGPLSDGGIHPLTKNAMNYIRILTVYSPSLDDVLKEEAEVDSELNDDLPNENELCSLTDCPTASQLKLFTSHLILNLREKSELYKDEALQSIFLMNNIHYMVQEVKESNLSHFFGNKWIRDHKVMFRKQAMMYGRVTWGPVLSMLNFDCNGQKKFKEICRGFANAFEKIYKRQTGWSIPNDQLRDELQISTSQKVTLAYQTWLSKNLLPGREKNAKYCSDDLGDHILDFFEGKQQSLNNRYRR